jgi:CRISPR-associated protein Csm5
MKDVFETKNARLSVLSPIHIGSFEQRLTPFEYVQSGQYVYPVSDDRLSQFLHKKKLIDTYTSAVGREGHRFRLLSFFRENRFTPSESDLLEISSGRKIRVIGDTSRLQDYRPFIRDGFGNIYVPGTSLKGVMRTAILYSVLIDYRMRQPREYEGHVINRIEGTETRLFKKKYPFQWIQVDCLQNFVLSNKSRSPNTDWLRMLHIRDAYPVNLRETNLLPVNVLKREGNGWTYRTERTGQNTTIWVEAIPPGAVFDVVLAWDKELHGLFKSGHGFVEPLQGLSDLVSKVDRFAKDIIEHEKRFSNGHRLCDWYKETMANIRIGFGSGMASTTILLLLPENLRKKVRNLSGFNRGDDVAPKSRRVWLDKEKPIPLGWAVLEFVE